MFSIQALLQDTDTVPAEGAASAGPADDVEDPLAFTEDEQNPFEDLDQLMERFSKDQRVKRALDEGVDLREYAKFVEAELKKTELAAVADYTNQAAAFAEVHSQIQTCDTILEQMEKLLSGFQVNLGAISAEIRHLQEESTALSVKLANRQKVSEKVSEFVESCVIPEEMARAVCDSEVNEAYLEYLVELNKRIEFVSKKKGTPPLAVHEIEPQLQKLKKKAVSRVREFLLQRIHALKKPRTNLQVIQHNVLSRFKYMNVFLQAHEPAVYDEIQVFYVDTMSKLYSAHVKAYLTGLSKLETSTATRYDLLGLQPEAKSQGWFSAPSKPATGNVFALGGRDAVLSNVGDAIVPHEAAEKGLKFTSDVLFRSLNQYLLDCVTSEWLFCMEWFGPNDLFGKIFAQVLQQILLSVGVTVKNSWDAVGLLLMARLTALNRTTMVRRGVPVLVPYFQKLDSLVLPRFLEVMAAHVQSVRERREAVASSGPVDPRPHFVTRRYAELATSLLVLTKDFKHPEVLACLNTLREEMFLLLERLSQYVCVDADKKEKERKRTIFFMANLDVVLSLLRDRDLVATETVVFEEKMEAAINNFVSELVTTYFAPLLNFVASATAASASGKPVDKEEAGAIVKSIHKTWKSDVQHCCATILSSGFSNFSLAGAVARKTLMEVTRATQRCWELIKEQFGPNAFTKFYVAPFQLRDEFASHTKMLGDIFA